MRIYKVCSSVSGFTPVFFSTYEEAYEYGRNAAECFNDVVIQVANIETPRDLANEMNVLVGEMLSSH